MRKRALRITALLVHLLFPVPFRGTEEHCGLSVDKVDIINSTLGKALGGAAGGYTTGPKPLIDLLRNRSRPYLFSNALPPPVVASAVKVFDLLMQPSSDLPAKLLSNTKRFRAAMRLAGFQLGVSSSD